MIYTFQKEQKLRGDLQSVWDFLCDPNNLPKITPSNMGFQVLTKNLPNKIYPGLMIAYKVKPVLGIPVQWLTEITQVKELEYFVDEQRVGPYAIWHHEHFIEEINGSILMKDIITYSPPFGFLGAIANTLVIEKKLNEIFEFRRRVLEKLF